MIFEIPKTGIFDMLLRQIVCYFPLSKEEVQILQKVYPLALAKCELNFNRNPNRYFHSLENDGEAYFNPFHSGQWTIFLYHLSHLLHVRCGGAN